LPSYAPESIRLMNQPRLVDFGGALINRVYAFEHAFFALQTGVSNVWCWSTIEHPFPLEVPENMRIIRTKPILLDQLKKFRIYYLEATKDHTRMYYIPDV
jgi:hypothetical protein